MFIDIQEGKSKSPIQSWTFFKFPQCKNSKAIQFFFEFPIQKRRMEQRLKTISERFQYFLNNSIPKLQCIVKYSLDRGRDRYYCHFDFPSLQVKYKCPFSESTQEKAYKLACLHYLYIRDNKFSSSSDQFDSYFDEIDYVPKHNLVCSFDEVMPSGAKEHEILEKIKKQLQDNDHEHISFSYELVDNCIKVENRNGVHRLFPPQKISSCTNDEKRRYLCRTAGEFLLSMESRLY
eukprot:NODE_65_length_25825_cov_1.353844.p11 type:complete len:234 gc:universal NODE_65_length_25825_cov_1.353844:13448-12747(-)